MKGICTKKDNRETITKSYELRIGQNLCGIGFNYYHLYENDIRDLIKIADRDPKFLKSELERLLGRITRGS